MRRRRRVRPWTVVESVRCVAGGTGTQPRVRPRRPAGTRLPKKRGRATASRRHIPQTAPCDVCKQRQRHQLFHGPRRGADMRQEGACGVHESRRGRGSRRHVSKDRGPPVPSPLGGRSILSGGGLAGAMSVPGLMYVYGGALVGAGLLGLDKGVPVAGPAPLVPLATGLGGTMLLFGYLSTPSGPHPPKKGEPGFGMCVPSSCCVTCAARAQRAQRRYMAAVHLGLLMPLAFTGTRRSRLAHAVAALTGVLFAGVFVYKAYTARAFTHNAGSLLGLAVRVCDVARGLALAARHVGADAVPVSSWGALSRSYGLSRSSLRKRWIEAGAQTWHVTRSTSGQTMHSVIPLRLAAPSQRPAACEAGTRTRLDGMPRLSTRARGGQQTRARSRTTAAPTTSVPCASCKRVAWSVYHQYSRRVRGARPHRTGAAPASA